MPVQVEIPLYTTVTLRSRGANGQENLRQEHFEGQPTEAEIVDRFTDYGPRPSMRSARNASASPSPCPSPSPSPAPPELWQIYPDTVPAIHMMHRRLSDQDAKRMVPALLQVCQRYNTQPTEVLETLTALRNIHRLGNQSKVYDDALRVRVLSVVLEMYGSAILRSPEEQIEDARKVSWVRVIQFSGDLTLTALSTTGITSTAAAATYMAGSYAGAQLATMKTATTTGAAAKAGLIGGAAAIGSATLGVATACVGAFSFAWWMDTIVAFRDTWDNNFARDAWFFHKMRDHHVLPDNGYPMGPCNHRGRDWTTINTEIIAWKKGYPRN